MGWFKGKKGKNEAGPEDEGPEVSSYSPEMPERQKSKLTYATSIQNFESIKSAEATVGGGKSEVVPLLLLLLLDPSIITHGPCS